MGIVKKNLDSYPIHFHMLSQTRTELENLNKKD